MGKDSSESRERLALNVAVSLGITQDEAFDLGTLAQKLAERNITFTIEGPYAGRNVYSGITLKVRVFVFYRFGQKIKDIGGHNFGGNDPLEMVLRGAKWILEVLQHHSIEEMAVERMPFWYKVMNWIRTKGGKRGKD